MTMSKKHFRQLAEVMKSLRHELNDEQFEITIDYLSNFCKFNNERFDEARFKMACYGLKWSKKQGGIVEVQNPSLERVNPSLSPLNSLKGGNNKMTCRRCDEDMYEEFINEIYPEVKIGQLTFSPGKILRELDPVAFRCGMSEEEEDLCDECKKEFD